MKSTSSVWGRMARIAVLLLLVISTSLGFASPPAHAGILDQINSVYDSAKTGGKDYFCRNGDISGVTFSTRSFKGELCANSNLIAGLSQYVCTNPDVAGFEGSSCDAKGKKKLAGADPLTVVKQEAKSASGPALALIKLFVSL